MCPSAAPSVPDKPLYKEENIASLYRTDTRVRPYEYMEMFLHAAVVLSV